MLREGNFTLGYAAWANAPEPVAPPETETLLVESFPTDEELEAWGAEAMGPGR